MDKHIVYSAIIKANEQANTELFGHQAKAAEHASAKPPSSARDEAVQSFVVRPMTQVRRSE